MASPRLTIKLATTYKKGTVAATPELKLGAKAVINGAVASDATVGAAYKLSKDTTVKAKLSHAAGEDARTPCRAITRNFSAPEAPQRPTLPC